MKNNLPEKIIVIVGPTASGKSDLAVALALRLRSGQAQKKFGIKGAEIISADSRQVYRGMDLGSGKITKKEMKGVPHYLLDVASPQRRFTAAQYKKLAQAALKKIRRQNKLPIICGGTGFYIQTLTDNLALPEVKPNLKLRAQLEKLSAPELYRQLKKLDPRRAKKIDRANRRRLIRALEIVYITGKAVPPINPPPASPDSPRLSFGEADASRGGQPSLKGGSKNGSPPLGGVGGDFMPLFLGIKKSPPELARRIKIRLQKRLKQGMLNEVKKLRAQGLSWKRLDGFGLEYRWLARYLQKKISRQEMTACLQKDSEHYAKRQMTWFKRDQRIRWIKKPPEAVVIVQRFLKSAA